jgi:hypothetical protein
MFGHFIGAMDVPNFSLGKDVVDSNKKEDWLAGLILYIKKGGVP